MGTATDDLREGLGGRAEHDDPPFDLPPEKEGRYSAVDDDELRRHAGDDARHRRFYDAGRRHARWESAGRKGPEPTVPEGMSDEEREIYESGSADAHGEHRSRSGRSGSARSVRQARSRLRQGAPAVVGAAAQLWRVAVVSLLIVALYLVLTNVQGVTGVIGGLQRAVTWLVSPTAVI